MKKQKLMKAIKPVFLMEMLRFQARASFPACDTDLRGCKDASTRIITVMLQVMTDLVFSGPHGQIA